MFKVKVRYVASVDTLKVEAYISNEDFWRMTKVNGKPDVEGRLIPCRRGDLWCPVIDLETGIITNWEIGKTASINYKVVDRGSYYLYNGLREIISCEGEYVPDFLAIGDKGYGDYIILDIDAQGQIKDWKIDNEDLEWFEHYQ